MEKTKPSPIFIVGVQRSGTTWLANQLCQHDDVVGVQHERHFGIHESAYFSHILGRYGNLRAPSNFIEFVEVMSASDYFVISGVGKESLYSLYGKDYAEIFRSIMDDFAERHDAAYWLEKTPDHSLCIQNIFKSYPDAKFVGIQRPVVDVLRSQIAKERKYSCSTFTKLRFIVREVKKWSRSNRILEKTRSNSDIPILLVSYEEMRTSAERVMSDICSFIGISVSSKLLEESFPRDTSFDKTKQPVDKSEVLSQGELLFIKILEKIFLSNLFGVFYIFDKGGHFENEKKRRDLPGWFFSLTRGSDSAGKSVGKSRI